MSTKPATLLVLGARSARRQAGISLIEMLIALLVLSFGLLGMAGLQAYSLRNNTNAWYRSQATALAYDIMDRIRANRRLAIGAAPGDRPTGSFVSPYTITLSGSSPTGGGIPGQDLREWKALVASRLPAGAGQVACNGLTAICTVTVQWDDSRGAGAPTQFVFSTEI